MHPLRKLRESGKPTTAQVSELLAENIVFNSPILVRPIEGREVVAAIFAQSSATRGSGTDTAEFKIAERTTFLRWVGTMDGHKFESLEIIVDNEQGLIVERTIALRPGESANRWQLDAQLLRLRRPRKCSSSVERRRFCNRLLRLRRLRMSIRGSGTTPNNFLYSGEWSDSSIGLCHLRERYYDQATGRFWTRDPMEGKKCCGLSWNPYIYVPTIQSTIQTSGREVLLLYLMELVDKSYQALYIDNPIGQCIGATFAAEGELLEDYQLGIPAPGANTQSVLNLKNLFSEAAHNFTCPEIDWTIAGTHPGQARAIFRCIPRRQRTTTRD